MAEMDQPPEDDGQAQDPAMVDAQQDPGPDDLPADDGSGEQLPPAQEMIPDEPQEPDDYAGPTEDQVVGDSRQLQVFGIKPNYEAGEDPLGEAWQDEAGGLQGTGMLAVMVFEPTAKQRYLNASLARDLSPLAVLEKRLARATWFRTELLEGDNESE